MGIKGIYRELGPGKRVSLAKLATEQLEGSDRPLRLAIDIAIWQFQTQAAKGGTNPAIRTLFYRLARLLSLAIHPIFVFDGPHKPAIKRNKRSGRGDGVATAMAKRLIRLFGFPIHDAPGEAEAECALLQQQGIVDAVLSEDVDTIMFGCTRTLRNWTAEGVRGSRTPTHVSLYNVNDLLAAGTGLDRDGMVLVALMSGGDYIPEGIPGCGVKLACEAAKAGFGKSLCRLKIDDNAQFNSWKASLKHELRTNESGFFRVRHKALSIPDEFPSRQVLRYYTHPVVSNAATIDKLRTTVKWSHPIDVHGLRYFVEETFDWVNKAGAVKLTRVLSQGLLVRKLLERHMSEQPTAATDEMEREEAALIKRISGRRSHHSTDGTPELRVAHVPGDIVGLDMSQELDVTVPFDRHGLALNSDEEFDEVVDGEVDAADNKTKAKATFDPTLAESIWLPESLLKLSVPLTVEDWEGKQRSKVAHRAPAKVSKKKATKASQESGALDKWMQTAKNARSTTQTSTTAKVAIGAATTASKAQGASLQSSSSLVPAASSKQPGFPPARILSPISPQQIPTGSSANRSKQSRSNGKATAAEPTGHKNPWAYAGSQDMPRITKSQQPSKPIDLSPSRLCSSPAPVCASLTSWPPQSILDLSGPEESTPYGPGKSDTRSSGPYIRPTGSGDGARRTSPKPSRIPTKNRRSVAQTRMDSFIISAPGHASTSGENLASQSYQRENSSETQVIISQPMKSTFVTDESYEASSRPQDEQATTTWLDEDTITAPQASTGRSKSKMVPRKSACGFFKVIETSDEEMHNAMSKRPQKMSWRRSCVSVIDLTGDDSL